MRGRIVLSGLILLVLVVALAACQAAQPPTPTTAPTKPAVAAATEPAKPTAEPAKPTTAPQPTAVPAPAVDLAAFQKAWESGPHNNKYDLYKGPNTYCAMCHSPKNWDPKATVGKPPNCFSCKFPTDKEVRISPLAPLIPEDKWAKIGCDVCHPNGKGPQLAIWNNGTGKYDPVVNSSALCGKCHVDSLGGSAHMIRLGGGAHSNQIGTTVHRPELCTDCHNPHTGKADCLQCHADDMKPEKKIQGHDAAHANVTCVACHDNSGAPVGIDPATKKWTTGSGGGGMAGAATGGATTFTPAYSHYFKKGVTCARCHFDKNPWGIWVPTPTPKPPTAVPKPTATQAK